MNLGETELAQKTHPKFASTPEQLDALKSIGVSYNRDGTINRGELDAAASGLLAKAQDPRFLRRAELPDDLANFSSKLEDLSRLYGDDTSGIPGMDSIVPTDLNELSSRLLARKTRNYGVNANQGEGRSSILEYLAKRKR